MRVLALLVLSGLAFSTDAIDANATSEGPHVQSSDLLPPGQPIVSQRAIGKPVPTAADGIPRAPLPVVPAPLRPANGQTKATPGATAIPWMTPRRGLNHPHAHAPALLPPGQPIVPRASVDADGVPRAQLPFVPEPIRPANGPTQAIPGATAIPWMTPPPGLDAPTRSKPPAAAANATAKDDDDDEDDNDDDDDDDDVAVAEPIVVLAGAAKKGCALPAAAYVIAASALVMVVAAGVIVIARGRNADADRSGGGWAPSWERDPAGKDGAYFDAEDSAAFLVADTR